MIKHVVFDMGGVLINFDAARYVAAFAPAREDQELLRRELFRSVEWIQLDRGTISDEAATRSICARLPERLHPAVSQIFENWHQDIPPLDGIYSLVEDLYHAGYHMYLLSNTSARFHSFRKNIPALRFFDGELISADCGELKPELGIYRKFLEMFRLNPEECLFIDDIPANIEAANRVNMSGIVYHGDPAELRRKMTAFGICWS